MGLSDTRTSRASSRLAGAAASTPRPWRIVLIGLDGTDDIGIQVTSDAADICALDEHTGPCFVDFTNAQANAELIVRAVNAHDDMLAALRAIVDSAWEAEREPEHTVSSKAIELAYAAIAKAEATGDRTAPAKTETGA